MVNSTLKQIFGSSIELYSTAHDTFVPQVLFDMREVNLHVSMCNNITQSLYCKPCALCSDHVL